MTTLPTVRDLEARVESPILMDILKYWLGFFMGGRLPSFHDVEPWKIKRALPYVWIWRRDLEGNRFFCRICGEQVNHMFGRNISGKSIEEAMPAAMAAEAATRWRSLIDGKRAHHLVGGVYSYGDQEIMGERLILPLAPAHNDSGGVLGATDAHQPTLRLISPVDPAKFIGIGVGSRADYDADPDCVR